MLATIQDVEVRLGEPIEPEDYAHIEGLIEEASYLVEGHCGRSFTVPAPRPVQIVVSRMVARVLSAPDEQNHASTTQLTAGNFSKSLTFSSGGSGGAPWLTAVDKKMLRSFGGRRGGIYTVELG